MNSFELLKVRTKEDVIDIELLERQYDFRVPPYLACFIQCFRIDKLAHNVMYVPDQEVGFDNFIGTIEFMIKSSQSLIFDDVYLEKSLIPLATSGMHSGGICIGTKGEEKDKIILDTDFPERFQIISPNIFLFINGLVTF